MSGLLGRLAVREAYASAFAGLALFAAYKWLSYERVLSADRRAAAAKPALSPEALLEVLRDVAKRAEAATAAINEASKQKVDTPEAMGRLYEAATALIQAELEAIQADVFAAHGVTAADVSAAHDFYTAPGGPGYSRKVADAASSVRKALGKHLITKGKVKVLFRDMFLHQCAHTEALAERLGEVMGRMGGPGAGGNPMELLQQLQMAQANEYLLARCGVGAQELMQRAQVLAKASEDEGFLEEFESLLQNGYQAVTQAIQTSPHINAMFGPGF